MLGLVLSRKAQKQQLSKLALALRGFGLSKCTFCWGEKKKLQSLPALASPNTGLIVPTSAVSRALVQREVGVCPVLMLLAEGFGKPGSSFPEQKSLLRHSTFLLALGILDSVTEACNFACEVCSTLVCSFTSKAAWEKSLLVSFLQGLKRLYI